METQNPENQDKKGLSGATHQIQKINAQHYAPPQNSTFCCGFEGFWHILVSNCARQPSKHSSQSLCKLACTQSLNFPWKVSLSMSLSVSLCLCFCLCVSVWLPLWFSLCRSNVTSNTSGIDIHVKGSDSPKYCLLSVSDSHTESVCFPSIFWRLLRTFWQSACWLGPSPASQLSISPIFMF